jgi:beta-xylosidase
VTPRLRCLSIVAAALGWLSQPAGATDYYLFTSFRNNGEDGLHLALSTDGYHWQALAGDRSFLKPEVGARIMRDPCIAQGRDGVFHLVWTSGWTADKGKVIGYASSRDLVHWSPQKAIPLMRDEPGVRNIWAPEIFYDRAKKRWLVFWSSTIPGRFAGSDNSGDDGYNHRFYYCTTTDFETFSPSKLFYDAGFNSIDATLLPAKGRFYLIFKDERKTPLEKKLRYAIGKTAEGPFGAPDEPFTGDWVEGPSAIRIHGEYLVYFDHYAAPPYYGAVRSKDLKRWEDCSKEMWFPPGQRHGTVIPLEEKRALALLAAP